MVTLSCTKEIIISKQIEFKDTVGELTWGRWRRAVAPGPSTVVDGVLTLAHLGVIAVQVVAEGHRRLPEYVCQLQRENLISVVSVYEVH